MSTNELSTDRNYLALTMKERVEIATGACKNPYDDARVPLRSSNGQIKRHVPLRHDSLVSDVLTAMVVQVANRFLDAAVQETFRLGAKWWDGRTRRPRHVATRASGKEVIACPRDDESPSTSEEPGLGHPDAEIIDLRTVREWRASAG